MPNKEAEEIIIRHHNRQLKLTTSLLNAFIGKEYHFNFAKAQEAWQLDLNRPLPPEIRFSKNGKQIVINEKGILVGKNNYDWSEILAVAIKTIITNSNFSEELIYEYHLLICDAHGDVHETELGHIASYKGLLPHFIGLFKRHSGTGDF